MRRYGDRLPLLETGPIVGPALSRAADIRSRRLRNQMAEIAIEQAPEDRAHKLAQRAQEKTLWGRKKDIYKREVEKSDYDISQRPTKAAAAAAATQQRADLTASNLETAMQKRDLAEKAEGRNQTLFDLKVEVGKQNIINALAEKSSQEKKELIIGMQTIRRALLQAQVPAEHNSMVEAYEFPPEIEEQYLVDPEMPPEEYKIYKAGLLKDIKNFVVITEGKGSGGLSEKALADSYEKGLDAYHDEYAERIKNEETGEWEYNRDENGDIVFKPGNPSFKKFLRQYRVDKYGFSTEKETQAPTEQDIAEDNLSKINIENKGEVLKNELKEGGESLGKAGKAAEAQAGINIARDFAPKKLGEQEPGYKWSDLSRPLNKRSGRNR